MMDAFEKLSQYRAGELSPEQMRALEAEPGFADGMKHLDALDAAVAALPFALTPARVEGLVQKVRRPGARNRARLFARVAVAVAAVAVAGGGAGWAWSEGWFTPFHVVPDGEVDVDGQAAHAAQVARGAFEVVTTARSSATVEGRGMTLSMAPRSRLEVTPREIQLRGTAVVRGHGVSLTVGFTDVWVDGVAVVSFDEARGPLLWAVTGDRRGPFIDQGWRAFEHPSGRPRLEATPDTTVVVVEGHARVHADEGVLEVAAGQYSLSDRAVPLPDDVAPPPVAPTPAQLTERFEKTLRANDALLGHAPGRADSLATDSAKQWRGSRHRPSSELLAELARTGAVWLRGPQLDGPEFSIPIEAWDAVHVPEPTQERVMAAWQASTLRVRTALIALAQEAGIGVGTMNQRQLLEALRARAPDDEWADAVRQVANERAGLAPRQAGGTSVYRALRVLADEDFAAMDALDQILGARADRFIDDPALGNLDHAFRVGPAPKR